MNFSMVRKIFVKKFPMTSPEWASHWFSMPLYGPTVADSGRRYIQGYWASQTLSSRLSSHDKANWQHKLGGDLR